MSRITPLCKGCKGASLDDLYQDADGDWFCGYCLMKEHDSNLDKRCPHDGSPLVFVKEAEGAQTRGAVCLTCKTAFIGMPKRKDPLQLQLLPKYVV